MSTRLTPWHGGAAISRRILLRTAALFWALVIATLGLFLAFEHCLKVVTESESLVYVVITRKDGFSLVHTKSGWEQRTLLGNWTPVNDSSLPRSRFERNVLTAEEVFQNSFLFEYSGIDWGWIHIGLSLKKFEDDLANLYRRTFLLTVICLGGSLLVALAFARRLTRPINLLDQITHRVASGDLSARADVRTGDELERLASSFNRMTESLQATQQELRAAQEYTEEIIRSLNEALVVTDVTGRITTLNDATTALLGWSAAELTGQPIAMILAAGSTAAAVTTLESGDNASTQALVGQTEREYVAKDGRTIPILPSASAIPGDNGEPRGWVYVAMDITKQKIVEQEIRAAKEAAEAANKAKSRFLANMSHEIRTPMSGVLGMLELLLSSRLGDEERHQAKLAYTSARHLLAILDDILDVSKIEAGKLTIIEEDFDLRRAAGETADSFSGQASAKGLTFSFSVDSDTPTVVRGDSTRLQQVLFNLVGNAIKFTESGSVSVTARPSGNGPEPRPLRFEVADTGIGISAEEMSLIFDPFSQADVSHVRRFGGTGLGLTISKELVQLMGGEIGGSSEPGRGSTFWFSLPMAASAGRPHLTTADVPASEGTPESLSGRILVVEDDPVNQEVTRGMLLALGLDAVVVGDGHEALRALLKAPYDVVLMDCQMPGMDGFEATRAIRELEAPGGIAAHFGPGHQPHVPIVAITAHAMQDDRDACLRAGMDDYLPKPFTQAKLGAVLRRWLQRLPDTRSPRSESSPIDPKAFEVLVELERSGAPGVVTRAVTAFLRSAPTYVEALRNAASQATTEDLARAAHTLKSSSANLGALTLADLCRTTESLALSGSCDCAEERVAAIVAEFDRVRIALEARLQQLGADRTSDTTS